MSAKDDRLPKQCRSVSGDGLQCQMAEGHDGDHCALRETGLRFADYPREQSGAVLASDRPKTPSVCRECRGVGGRHKLDCEAGKRAPREQATGLAEAEARLRFHNGDGWFRLDDGDCETIADELDRLRALVRKLGGEP